MKNLLSNYEDIIDGVLFFTLLIGVIVLIQML